MIGYKITESQKSLLTPIFGLIFNAVKNINDEYFISENEYFFILGLWYLDECPTELIFVKDLSLSIYEPKISENPFI